MTDDIYLIRDDGTLVEMSSQPYDSEELLQRLLAEYPSLLAGEQIDGASPRRWLLITREMGVPSDEDSGNRWSLDHLFLDQDGIPTLVEVKRSTDNRIRREVIGQMLDYASNAVVYWPIEEVRSRFVSRCEAENTDPDEELARFLGEEDVDSFWSRVKTNLQAGKIRLLFVADEIPSELRRVVEFLNSQMDPAEVLAVEIKQYLGETLKTLVPRVFGQTAEAQQKKSSGRREARNWDEDLFFTEIERRCGSEVTPVAREIYEWTKKHLPDIRWGKGKVDGSFTGICTAAGYDHSLFAVYTSGQTMVNFGSLKARTPFDNETKRLNFLGKLSGIPGVDLAADTINRFPSIPLTSLASPDPMRRFLAALEWAVGEIKNVRP